MVQADLLHFFVASNRECRVMLDGDLLRDTSVVALAGRRIDELDTRPPHFPAEAVPIVRRRLADLFARERAVALVCSAACGADLIALGVAERFGLRRRIILPFRPDHGQSSALLASLTRCARCGPATNGSLAPNNDPA
jgi:hypothetical protein